VDYAFAYASIYPVVEEKYYPYILKQSECKKKIGFRGVQLSDHWEI